MNKLEDLSEQELRALFIRATDELRRHKIFSNRVAERIQFEKGIPRMNPKRMRNIRSNTVGLIPDVEEVQALFDLYPDELKEIREEVGQPSPMERRLMELEKEMSAIKKSQFNEIRNQYDEIQKLMQEKAILYQKIAELKEKLKKHKD